MTLMMGMFGTAQPALLAFPEERPVFLREYSTDHYSVGSYFLSRLTMELFITALQICIQVSLSFGLWLLRILTKIVPHLMFYVVRSCSITSWLDSNKVLVLCLQIPICSQWPVRLWLSCLDVQWRTQSLGRKCSLFSLCHRCSLPGFSSRPISSRYGFGK